MLVEEAIRDIILLIIVDYLFILSSISTNIKYLFKVYNNLVFNRKQIYIQYFHTNSHAYITSMLER